MSTLSPIQPRKYITEHAPAVEPSKDISSWFAYEQIELNFGESEGRPNKDIHLHKEYLTRFLENGWTVDQVLSSSEGGHWQQVSQEDMQGSGSGSTSLSGGSSSSSSYTSSQTQSAGSSTRREESSGSSSSSSGSGTSGTSSASYSNSESSGSAVSSLTESRNTSEDSRKSENTNTSEKESTKTTSTSEGAAYWYAYQRIRLKRRRMLPENVLQSMVTSYTNEYNSGRSIDNERYNELLSLYSVMLSRTESESNVLVDKAMDFTPLFNKVVSSVEKSLSAAHNTTVNMGTDVRDSAIADINRQFDVEKSTQMSNMISAGMFNNTVWASVAAGIERQRAAALAKARAESSQIVANSYTSVAQAKGSVWSALLAARQSMSDALDKRRITATEVRNNVLKWMLDYAGSREEVYPTLEEVSNVAQQLGFSVGASSTVL